MPVICLIRLLKSNWKLKTLTTLIVNVYKHHFRFGMARDVQSIVQMCKLQNLQYCKSRFSSIKVRTVRSVRFVPSSFNVRVRFGSVVSTVRVRFIRFGFGSFPISSCGYQGSVTVVPLMQSLRQQCGLRLGNSTTINQSLLHTQTLNH
jgi:hypothetical protein